MCVVDAFINRAGYAPSCLQDLFSPPLKYFVNDPSFLRCFQGMDHEDDGNLNVQKYHVTIINDDKGHTFWIP